MPDLTYMLQFCRPAGSKAERQFIHKLIDPLGATADAIGNRYIQVGSAPHLWSAHTDTVHRQGGRQNLWIERDKQGDRHIMLPPDSQPGSPFVNSTVGSTRSTSGFVSQTSLRALDASGRLQ